MPAPASSPSRPRLPGLAALLALLGVLAAAPAARAAAAHFPLPPAELEPLLAEAPFEIREHEWVAGWRYAVYRIEAFFPSIDRTLEVKWKSATPELEARNNTPRREAAAYEIQKWFLAPDRYVVPTTVVRCLPLESVRRLDAEAEPNVPVGTCVFGSLSIWLQHVVPPDALLDLARFHTDPAYATHVAHYNLLTYLIENLDTRPANALVSEDPAERRVFSIDNGVSFGEPFYNPLRSHWNELRVPALPHAAIDRLREVGDAELEALATLAEFELAPERAVRVHSSDPFDARVGVRRRGDRVQFGLGTEEIDGIRRRLHALLGRVDAGEIPLF